VTTALVSGGASGIGRSVVQRFVDGGWHVLAVDRDEAALAAAWSATRDVTPIAVDVTDSSGLQESLGRSGVTSLAACINVAGIYPPSAFLTFAENDYRRTFDVNVLGTLLASRAALPYLRMHPGTAAIVNFASTGAYAPGDGHLLLYRASKAAVVSLTRSMAFELAPHIRVNGIAPGPIATDEAVASGGTARYRDSIPVGAPGRPEDIAEWVWALAGSQPLPFILGETIVVSGGALMR
jgi:3-oxoacyl-[acyl-carrier protein] reductase